MGIGDPAASAFVGVIEVVRVVGRSVVVGVSFAGPLAAWVGVRVGLDVGDREGLLVGVAVFSSASVGIGVVVEPPSNPTASSAVVMGESSAILACTVKVFACSTS